jgi:CHASE2 domain-containing sensor protein
MAMDEVIVVERDEASYRELNQEYGKQWDRSLYVRFLDQVTRDHARLVVMDIFFADPGEPVKNDQLAQAMRRNGRVILAMDYREYSGIKGGEPIYPRGEFKESCAALGVSAIRKDDADGVVRQIFPGTETNSSLPWAAATQAGVPESVLESRLRTAKWLNYPSSLNDIRKISFSDALQQSPGYFANKYVFIGGAPPTKLEGDLADQFTPPTRWWGGQSQPGVIFHALAFLNLLHGSFLQRVPAAVDALVVLLLGALLPFAFRFTRPLLGAFVAVSILLAVFAGACVSMFFVHRWCSWTILALVQNPFAFAWSALAALRRVPAQVSKKPGPLITTPTQEVPEKATPGVLEAQPGDQQPKPVVAQNPSGTIVLPSAAFGGPASTPGQVRWLPPSVPDHTLVRCIGEGGYGQVWLARSVLGRHHAVKFVFRKTFPSAVPFDREFTGIHHFTPISRMHPGFVHILHVGRNEAAGYFFYIMELADDINTGQAIDPSLYSAKTLSRVIRTTGRLSVVDCVQIGVQLSAALDFLHTNRLVHRDIKPANVLYVHGHAKFADVGLVTEIRTKRGEVTYIGTEGYIAPEGPGTPGADVYALGKLLYECAMGLDRKRYPDLPTSVVMDTDPLLPRLNQIILKACESNPLERYQSANALHGDLERIRVDIPGTHEAPPSAPA